MGSNSIILGPLSCGSLNYTFETEAVVESIKIKPFFGLGSVVRASLFPVPFALVLTFNDMREAQRLNLRAKIVKPLH